MSKSDTSNQQAIIKAEIDAQKRKMLIKRFGLFKLDNVGSPLKGNQIKSSLDNYASIKPTTKIKPISIIVVDHKVANAFYHFKWESKDSAYSN